METEQPVASVVRALKIMLAFDKDNHTLSLAEISRRTSLYKSTALRLLTTLETEGFIKKNPDGQYGLGSALWRLGTIYESSIDLRSMVMPLLQRMSDETLETTSFDIREKEHRLCIARVSGRHPVRDYPIDGAILPLGKGAPGRVLVDFADGPQMRSGYDLVYVSLGERHPEMASISVPIFGVNDVLHGAICISGTMSRYMDNDYLEQLKCKIITSASELASSLGGRRKIYDK